QTNMLEPRDQPDQPAQRVEAHLARRPPRFAGHEPWIEFHEYRRIVQKHLRLVIVIALVCMGLTLVHDLMAEPTYTASTTLLIRSAPSRVFQDETVSATQDSSQEPYDDTQSELLKSSSLATRVILDQGLMKLDARPSHASRSWLPGWSDLRSALAGWFPSLAAKQAAPTLDDPLADSVPRSVVQWYLGALQVKPIENTQLVQVE